MADSKTQKSLAKAVKSGSYKPSAIGAKARAAAAKLQSMGTSQAQDNVTKLPESRHLQSQQFPSYSGRHRAAPNFRSAMRNARGTDVGGKHRKFDWFSKAA